MKELERIEKMIVESGGREGTTFLARNSNLPPKLLAAAFTELPNESYKEFINKLKLKSSSYERIVYLGLIGKPGRGKTLAAVKYYVHLLAANKRRSPLFLTAYDLFEYYKGRIELHRFAVSEVEISSWFEAKGSSPDTEEIIPFSQLTRKYDLILVDDLVEEAYEAFEKLCHLAYTTDTLVIFTTNEDPVEALSPRIQSRFFESALMIDFDDFPYLRQVRRLK